MTSNNDQDKTEHQQTDSSDAQSSQVTPIFSQDEINSAIKDFVLGWIRGKVTIDFPDSEAIKIGGKKLGRSVDNQLADHVEEQGKNHFVELISICGGLKPSTQKELREANCELFEFLLYARMGRRIEGEFSDDSLRSKVAELEEKLNATIPIIEQLTFYVKTGVKPS